MSWFPGTSGLGRGLSVACDAFECHDYFLFLKSNMRLLRSGSTSTGIFFHGLVAPYIPRGWIEKLTMPENGPQVFSIKFGKETVATTTNGTITIDNFSQAAKDAMEKHATPSDPLRTSGLINFCYQPRITIVTPEVPDRQIFFVTQDWQQVFETKPGIEEPTNDMDLVEVPCLRLFNLRAEDKDSRVVSTKILQAEA